MKKLFETKYRIMPVYREHKQVGYVVYSRGPILRAWTIMALDVLSPKIQADFKGENNTEVDQIISNERPAYFKTDEEAKQFIERLKTLY